MGEPEKMCQFAGKMILVLFKLAVYMDNAPDSLKHRLLLLFAEFIIYMAGKFKKINRLAPLTMSQFQQLRGSFCDRLKSARSVSTTWSSSSSVHS